MINETNEINEISARLVLKFYSIFGRFPKDGYRDRTIKESITYGYNGLVTMTTIKSTTEETYPGLTSGTTGYQPEYTYGGTYYYGAYGS